MLTSSFHDYRGAGRISIARRAPRNDSGYRVFSQLAPGPWFSSVTPREYVTRYFSEILRPLNPQKVYDELRRKADGAEPVLLCWEKCPLSTPHRWWERSVAEDEGLDFSNYCHRRMAAAWLEDNLGLIIPEWAKEEPQSRLL